MEAISTSFYRQFKYYTYDVMNLGLLFGNIVWGIQYLSVCIGVIAPSSFIERDVNLVLGTPKLGVNKYMTSLLIESTCSTLFCVMNAIYYWKICTYYKLSYSLHV